MKRIAGILLLLGVIGCGNVDKPTGPDPAITNYLTQTDGIRLDGNRLMDAYNAVGDDPARSASMYEGFRDQVEALIDRIDGITPPLAASPTHDKLRQSWSFRSEAMSLVALGISTGDVVHTLEATDLLRLSDALLREVTVELADLAS